MVFASAVTYSRAKASKRDDTGSLESTLWYSVGLDVRSLAAFRILASVAMLLDIIWRLPELHEHYGPRGVMRIETAAIMVDETPLRFLTTPMGEMYYPHVFALSIFFATTLLFGLYSRMSCFLAWLCMMEYQNRNDILNDYGDAMLRNFLLLASFLPIGEVFSLDALFKSDSELAEIIPPKRSPATIAAAAAANKSGGDAKTADAEEKKDAPVLPVPVVKSLAVATLAGLACWAHVIMEYVCTAHLKTGSHWHSKDEGNAVYFAVGDERLSLPMGRLVIEITPHWVMNLFIDLVLGWEYVGPILVLFGRPAIRTISCLLFIFMHLNFCTFINLGPLFSLTCPAMWTLLIPAWLWDTLASFFRVPVASADEDDEDSAADENNALKSLHPADTALAYVRSDQKLLRWALRVFSVFFFSPLTIPLNDFTPVVSAAAAAGKSKAVNNKTRLTLFAYGTVYTDYEACAHLLRLSAVPILPRIADSALSDTTFFGKLGRSIFQFLSSDVSVVASPNAVSDQVIYGRKKRRNVLKSILRALQSVLTGFFFVYIVISNLESIEFFEDTVPYPDKAEGETRVWFKTPEWLETAGGFFRLQQSWSMYAPNVDRDNGWFVFLGKYQNGTTAKLDVWSLEPPILTPPKVVFDTYKTFRWNEYLITYYDKVEDFLDDDPAEDTNWFLEDFGEFLCNRYRTHLGLPPRYLPPKKSKNEFRNRFKVPKPKKVNGTYQFPPLPPTPAPEHPDMISHVYVHYMLLRTPAPFEKREGKNWNVLKYKCYGY